MGYRVSLYFLALPSADAAVERVVERVRQGGHNIPESVIRRRFAVGWRNFEQYYRASVDDWVLYDNSESVPVILQWGSNT
jgi:predicted ABC-type ATPase